MESFYNNKFIKFMFDDKIFYFNYNKTIKITFALSFYCFVVGVVLWVIFNNPVEYELRYDDQCKLNEPCKFNIKLNKDITGPAYIYLKLENFYLNHRLIVNSYSPSQLQGATITDTLAKTECGFYFNNKNGQKKKSIDGSDLKPNDIMNPCGWKPFLYFKDIYKITQGSEINIQTTGIISKTYMENKYTNNVNKDKSQWINYQDEFFLQWMQTPTFKNFERLYGIIPNGLKQGEYTLEITSKSKALLNSVKKSFLIKNLTFLGGKNLNLVYAHMFTSAILFMSGLIWIIYENNSKFN